MGETPTEGGISRTKVAAASGVLPMGSVLARALQRRRQDADRLERVVAGHDAIV
jgi:hypothetical protein